MKISKTKEKIIVFILGLIIVFTLAEIGLRLFIGIYLSTMPESYQEKMEKIYHICGSFSLDKLLKFDPVCGFLPKRGFFRAPPEKFDSGDYDKYHIIGQPYIDYYYYDKEKKEDIRIICLGDSTTYGGTLDYYDSYPYILEKLLNRAFPDKDIKVLNAGLSNASSKQLKRIFQFYLVEYNPDIITWRMGTKLTDSYEVSINPFSKIKYTLWRCLYYLRTFRVFCILIDINRNFPPHTTRDKIYEFIMKKLILDNLIANWKTTKFPSDFEPGFKADFEIVKKIAYEHGINHVIAIDYVNVTRKGDVIDTDCLRYKKKNLTPVVCTFKNFNKKLAACSIGDLFVDSCHLTKLGNIIIAQEVFEFLIDHDWFISLLKKGKNENEEN